MIEILVNTTGPWSVREDLLTAGARAALEEGGIREAEVSITLLDDEGIEALNREYFGKPWPTDVIAFSLHEEGDPVLGDVYLGFLQARRQSRELKIPLDEELLRLAIHGTLHVLGHDHPEGDDRSRSEMYSLQEELLRRVLKAEGAG